MSEPNPYASPGPVDPQATHEPPPTPQFILSGRTPGGRLVTERVEADSSDAAVEMFRARNYTDIVLHTDDVSASLRFPKDAQRRVSPRGFVDARTRHGYLGSVALGIRMLFAGPWWRSLLLWLPWVALIVMRRLEGFPWGLWDYGLVGFLILPVVLMIVAPLFFFSSRTYHRLTEDAAWGRWQAVLDRLPRLRKSLPPDAYAFHEADAMAGLGRLDEAIELVRPLESREQMPLWLYWGRLGGIYFRAKQYDQGIACLESAIQQAPNNPTVIIDLALSLLRYRRDAQRGRPLLEEARGHALSDMIIPCIETAEGILALEENRPAEAQRLLQQSLDTFQPFVRANPLLSAWQAMIHAYLALTFAAMADHASAQRHYGLAEPQLRALKSDDLIDRCQQALQGKTTQT